LIVVGVKMGRDSFLVGRRLKDVATSPRFFHVSALRRMDYIMIPRGDTEIMEGDILYFSVLPENVASLRDICGGRGKESPQNYDNRRRTRHGELAFRNSR